MKERCRSLQYPAEELQGAAVPDCSIGMGARIQPSCGEGETQTTDATAGLRLWGIWDTWTGPPGLQEVLGEKTFMENNSSIGQRVLIVFTKKKK